MKAGWVCEAQYPGPVSMMDSTQDLHDYFTVQYEYFTTYYLDCMDNIGIHIDRTNIPSKEAWVNEYVTSQNTHDSWWPRQPRYWVLKEGTSMTEEKLREMDWTYPESPSPHWLYGK